MKKVPVPFLFWTPSEREGWSVKRKLDYEKSTCPLFKKMTLTPFLKFTKSEEETRKIGRAIGRSLLPGDIICLVGELGSGKTTITQGIAQGLGVGGPVNSASFKLINEYKGRIPVYHFDLFRLNKLSEVEELGYREYFYNQGVTIIEWAEKMRPLWPEKRMEIELKIISGDNREIKITNLIDREINVNGNSGNRDIN